MTDEQPSWTCRHCGDPVKRSVVDGNWTHDYGTHILYSCQHTVPYGQVAEVSEEVADPLGHGHPGEICRFGEYGGVLTTCIQSWRPPEPCPSWAEDDSGVWFCEGDEGHEGECHFWQGGPK